MLRHFINIPQYITSSVASQPELYQCTQSCVWGCGVGERGAKHRGGDDLNIVSQKHTHTSTWDDPVPLSCAEFICQEHVWPQISFNLRQAVDIQSPAHRALLMRGSHPPENADADIKNKVGVTAFKWAHGDCRSFSGQHSSGTNGWNGRTICLRHHLKWLLRDG